MMRTAHEVMMRYPPYRDEVVVCNGFFVKADPASDEPTVLDVLAAPSDRYLRAGRETASSAEIRHSNDTLVGALAPDDR